MKILFVFMAILMMALSFTQKNYSSAATQDSIKTCIVSGEVLKDDKVSYIYLDKTYDFCCNGCVKSFKKEPAKYIEGNLKCAVCDNDDAVKEIFSVKDKVKYYFSDDACKEKFEQNPDEYLGKYNAK